MRRGSVAGRRRTNEKPRDPRRNSRTLANYGGSPANHVLGRVSLKSCLRLAGVQRDAGRTDVAGGGPRSYLRGRAVEAWVGNVTGVDNRGRKQCEQGQECAGASPACYASRLHGHSLSLDADELRFRSSYFCILRYRLWVGNRDDGNPLGKGYSPLRTPLPESPIAARIELRVPRAPSGWVYGMRGPHPFQVSGTKN